MDTPEAHAPDNIARVAADDVRRLFERAGLRAIVRLADAVAAEERAGRRGRAPGDRRAPR